MKTLCIISDDNLALKSFEKKKRSLWTVIIFLLLCCCCFWMNSAIISSPQKFYRFTAAFKRASVYVYLTTKKKRKEKNINAISLPVQKCERAQTHSQTAFAHRSNIFSRIAQRCAFQSGKSSETLSTGSIDDCWIC